MKFIAKKYYTFKELEARWECTSGDLIQSVIDGELMPSLHMQGGSYLLNIFTPCDYDATDSFCRPSQLTDPSIDNLDNEIRSGLLGFRYLILPERTGAWDCVFRYFSFTPLSRNEGDLCYSLEHPVDIEHVLKSGIVMADEVARVEAKSTDITVPSSVDKPLSTAARNTPTDNIETDVDPLDLPVELDAANIAFRSVKNGYGDQAATFRNRVIDYLKANHSHMTDEALQRIATVANPDKTTGRKKSGIE
jgi:hypothetical protein